MKKNIKRYIDKSHSNLISLFLAKLIIFISGVIYHFKFIFTNRKLIKEMKMLKGAKKGKKVLLCANGSSLLDINWKKVRQEQLSGDLDLFVLNHFLAYSKFEVNPDYLCLVDPIYLSDLSLMPLKRKKTYDQVLERAKKLHVFCPASFIGKDKFRSKNYFFAGVNKYSCNVRNVLKPLGYKSYTSLYSLSICLYLDYDMIYLAGYDNDYFKDYYVEGQNKYIKPKHFYDHEERTELLDSKVFDSTSSVLFSFYEQYYFFEKFKKYKSKISITSGGLYFDFLKRDDMFNLKEHERNAD